MNIKEKIKKSFKPCKRLKLLEYNEFLEKEELQDSPTARAMYCEYKSQVDEKNQKADMCLSQKIGGVLFAIVLTIVIICLFVNQVSATVYIEDDLIEQSFATNNEYGGIVLDGFNYAFNYYNFNFKIFGCSSSDGMGNTVYGFAISDIDAFQGLCSYLQISTFSDWQSFINSNYPTYDSGDTMPPLNDYYFNSEKFLTVLNYHTITETDLINAKKEGISESIDATSDVLRVMGILYEGYPNNGTISTLDSLLTENIGIGLQNANTTGYNSGLARGESVFKESQAYQDILNNKFQEGYTQGENTAPVVESALRSFFNAPINFISNVLNFEIFGINLWSVFTFILTLGLIFFVIRKVVGL